MLHSQRSDCKTVNYLGLYSSRGVELIAKMFKPVCMLLVLWASAAMATPRLFASLAGAPDFCGAMDCPPYKLIHETDNYEIRSYGSGTGFGVEVVKGPRHTPL